MDTVLLVLCYMFIVHPCNSHYGCLKYLVYTNGPPMLREKNYSQLLHPLDSQPHVQWPVGTLVYQYCHVSCSLCEHIKAKNFVPYNAAASSKRTEGTYNDKMI